MKRYVGFLSFLSCLFILLLSTSGFAASHKKTSSSSTCDTAHYACLKVKAGQSWTSLFPQEKDREIVMRVNHTNQRLYAGRVIRVPKDLAEKQLNDYSPMPQQISAPGEKTIIVNPALHAWAAYAADGSLVRWGPATAGSNWCRDLGKPCRTKVGSFRIYSLGSSGCKSTKFPRPRGGAPMPYCMFFNGGQALHGSPGEVVATNASHGCVRMFVDDAQWLRYDFVEGPNSANQYRGTKVIILPYHS